MTAMLQPVPELPSAEARRRAARRLGCEALLAVVILHALLLAIFRYAPRENPPESGELPAVEMIDLNVRGNRELVQWLTVHDPALLTAPHAGYGYSAVAAEPRSRRVMEDLPHPPLLTAPETPLPEAEAGGLPAGRVPSLLRLGKAASGAVPGGESRRVKVSLNGRNWDAPGKGLTAWLDRQRPEGVSGGGRRTEIAVAAPRQRGLRPRLLLETSCGAPEWDRAALRELRVHWSAAAPDAGTVCVEWPAAPETADGGERMKQ